MWYVGCGTPGKGTPTRGAPTEKHDPEIPMKLRILNPFAATCAAIAIGPFAIADDKDKATDMTMGAASPRGDTARHDGEHQKLIAWIRPVGDSNVKGTVVFEKVPNGVKVTAKVGGFEEGATHAIHIHEFGDLGSPDASSAGEHFNPDGHPHGKPGDEKRHAGDLGEFRADSDGVANYEVTVDGITLDTGKRGILGRAVIIHERGDDGSQPSGNAGDRIGAGVIGVSKDAHGDHDMDRPDRRADGDPSEEPDRPDLDEREDNIRTPSDDSDAADTAPGERRTGPDVTSPGTPSSEGIQVNPDEQP